MGVFKECKKLPRVKAICDVAEILTQDLFPGKKIFCINSALFGTCFSNCKCDHTPIIDNKAKTVISKLKKALENPDRIQVTN